MTRFLLCFGCWALAAGACAQTSPTTRRLWQDLRRHPAADTGRVRRLNVLAENRFDLVEPSDVPPPVRDSLARQALALARRLGDDYGQAFALYNLATASGNGLVASQTRARLQQALPLAERAADPLLLMHVLAALSWYEGATGRPSMRRALALARATGRPALLADCYGNESAYFLRMEGDYNRSLQSIFRALDVARRARLPETEVLALINIGERYKYLGDYDQALNYARQTTARAARLVNAWRGSYFQSRALAYTGDCYRLTGRYAPAIVAYRQALRTNQRIYLTLMAKSGLADAYERQGSPQALPYARRLLAETNLAQQPDQRRDARARVCATLGRYYLRSGQPDSAVAYGRQSLRLTQYTIAKEPVRDALQLLADAYAQRREFAPAYAYLRRYLGLRDTLNSEQVTRQATAARFTRDLAGLRQARVRDAAQARQRLIVGLFLLSGVFLLLVLSVVFYLAYRRSERLKRLVTVQKQDLQSQRDQLDASLTSLRATQAQLIQKEKMASLGELTAGIAHEIQNPLNFVNNFAEVSTELVAELKGAQAAGDAAEVTALADDLAQNLGKIHQHGQRAASIVRGMLEHSRTSAGERAPTDLNRLADEYLRLAYQGLRAKDKSFNCALETDFAPGLPLVEAVGADVGRVLLNLFGNAFYAVQKRQQTGEAGYQPTVRVSTRPVGGQVEIRVADNGTGMSAAVQAKIFQPFFTTKPLGEGTGLGLSLSHDIVTTGHGGTLRVESTEGQGTEFILGLPV